MEEIYVSYWAVGFGSVVFLQGILLALIHCLCGIFSTSNPSPV
jgi:hypothetical protein